VVRHVVLFTWTAQATDEQKERVSTELARLRGLVPGIRGYEFGPDAGLVPGANAGYALTADFDDADAYLAYRHHPAHIDFVEKTINPILAQRVSAQFEF
jgi:Stress responsive A/B Barrel Domain